MKKQFYRVKHLADRKFSRSRGANENFSDELQIADKKIEYMRNALTQISKRLPAPSTSSSASQDPAALEKRLRKIPEHSLGTAMCDAANSDDDDSIIKYILEDCGTIQKGLAKEKAELDIKVEQEVSVQISDICNQDLPAITKAKRQLNKLIADKYAATNMYQNAQRQQNHNPAKIKMARDELEEVSAEVESAEDGLAVEMFSMVTREAEVAHAMLRYIRLQREYHEAALVLLTSTVPDIERFIHDNSIKPMFAFPLADHLKGTGRSIAFPIELCVCMLHEIAQDVQGVLRIPGTASKVKSMKLSLDAGLLTIPLQRQYINVHVLSSVLKAYLQELPEPLLTYRLYDAFLTVSKQPTEKDRLDTIWETIHKLPDDNYQNLRYLIKFLAVLAKNQSQNKMSPSNLAIVIAPNLLWSTNRSTFDMNTTSAILCVVETMIRHADWFFKDDINFFITFSREELLQEHYEREAIANLSSIDNC